MKKLVTVIIPVYNSERTIERSLDSVLSQTYSNLEIIVIDDNSTDATVKLVNDYQKVDNRINLIKKTNNKGVADSRNLGILSANGKYVAFLDSDDSWHPDKISKQITFMEKNDIYFSYTDYNIMSEGNRLLAHQKSPNKVSYERAILGNMIGASTVVLNIEKIGQIQIPLLEKRNDAALWLRALDRCQYAVKVEGYLVNYYKMSDSLSSGKKSYLLKYHFQMYRDSQGYSRLTSALLTAINVLNYGYKKMFYFKKIEIEEENR